MKETSQKKSPLIRFLPLGVLAIGLIAFFSLGLHRYLTFEQLKENREILLTFVTEWTYVAPLIYIGMYMLMAALSLPGGLVLTIGGGFLFGSLFGTMYTVLGASIGASIIFSFVKMGLGESFKKSAGGFMEKMRSGFSKNAFSYLMVLRILPVFPFWLVNIVPAFLSVNIRTFFTATLLGIIPGTFVYSSIGEGLGSIFDKGETPNLGIIFEPQILTPILGLAVLAILPVFKNKIMGLFEKKN